MSAIYLCFCDHFVEIVTARLVPGGLVTMVPPSALSTVVCATREKCASVQTLVARASMSVVSPKK